MGGGSMSGSHSKQRPADGIHTPISFTYPTEADRLNDTGLVDPDDLYKFALQSDTNNLYWLLQITPSVIWVDVGNAAIDLSDVDPSPLGSAASGVSIQASRADHVHPHGDQSGGTLHAEATSATSGFMSGGDKSKLDADGEPAGQVLATESLGTSNWTSRPTLDGVDLQTGLGNPSHVEGRLFYDDDNKCMGFYNDELDSTLQVGRELWVRVYNNTGSTLLDGRTVYVSGADVGTGLPTVAYAIASDETTAQVLGVVTHDIESGTTGYVCSHGTVRGLDTSSFASGAVVFLSATTPGLFTTTAPSAPDYTTRIGHIIFSDAVTGAIHVSPRVPQLLGFLRIRVRNETGGLLSKGTLVVSTGFSASEQAYTVAAADKDSQALRPAVAVLEGNLPDATTALGLVAGVLTGVDTSTYSITDQLVLGNSGSFSRPPPDVDPFTGEVQLIGSVLRTSVSDGEILISLEGLLPLSADGLFALPISLARGIADGLQVTRDSGLTVDVAAGSGFILSGGETARIVYAGGSIVLPANSVSFIYIDSSGTLNRSATHTSSSQTLVLAVVRTNATDVVYLSAHKVVAGNTGARIHTYLREAVGPLTVSGGTATVNGGDALRLDVDASIFYQAEDRHTTVSVVAATWAYWYRDGSGGHTLVPGVVQIDPDNYDDGSGSLVPVPAGEWKKDALYITANDDGAGVEFHVLYAQETHSDQSTAEASPRPFPPDALKQYSLISSGVVSQQGSGVITSIVDERPFSGQLASGFSAGLGGDHGFLGGLGDDDHPQYQLRNEKNVASGYAGLDGSSALQSSQVRGIRESGGPTVLTLGSIPDGSLLRRSGTSLVGSSATKYHMVWVEPNSNFNNMRTRSIGSTGSQRFDFWVPPDFLSLSSAQLLGVPNGSSAAADIDLTVNYAGVGESPNLNTAVDTAATYSLVVNVLTAIDLAPLLGSLGAGDFGGVFVDHKGIGLTVEYYGILLAYN